MKARTTRCQILAFLLLVAIVGCSQSPDVEDTRPQSYNVFIVDAGDQKIVGIKAIRTVTDLGLADAKDLFEAAPTVVLSELTLDQAETAAAELRKAGMTIEIRND